MLSLQHRAKLQTLAAGRDSLGLGLPHPKQRSLFEALRPKP